MLSLSNITFYAILDTGYVSPADWLDAYDALVDGGAGIVQIRAKRETPAERAALLERVVERRADPDRQEFEQPHLIINDDLELCRRYPDLGLHIGQDDVSPLEARRALGPNRLLGLSTHSREQALNAINLGSQVLSYFAVGPVFATQTKPESDPVGLQLVRFVADQHPELPFFCIGGINRGNIPQVKAAGASKIVTVSDVLCDHHPASAVRQSIALMHG